MITVSEAFKSWLVSCIGLRLLLALGLFHVFESEKNGAPQAVSLFFDGQGEGTLMCAPDGASIAPNAGVKGDGCSHANKRTDIP